MNPILLKEVRGTLRTRRFFWAFTGTLFILGTIFLLTCLSQSVSAAEDPERAGKLLFNLACWTLAGAILAVFPAFSCTALASERELKSFDLLVTSRMTPSRIVFGKFSAAMVYAGLFLAAALPLIQISFLFGGVSPLEVLAAFAGLLALAAAVTSVSLGISAPFRGTRWPTALAYAACLGGLGWLTFLFAMVNDMASRGRMVPGFRSLFVLETPAAVLLALVSLPLILAVRSTQHPSDNRATALRVFFPAFLAAGGWMGWRWLDLAWNGWGIRRGWTPPAGLLWGQHWICLLAVLLFLIPWIFLFACESPYPSRKVERQAARWGRFPLLRLLCPGSHRGAPYALAVSAAFFLACLIPLRSLFPGAWQAVPPRCSMEGVSLGLSILLFLCGTGFFLSTLMRPRRARLVLLLVTAAVCLLPIGERARRERALEDGGKDLRSLPLPAWTLPFASPTLAALSWRASAELGMRRAETRKSAREGIRQALSRLGSQPEPSKMTVASLSKRLAFGDRDARFEMLRDSCRGWLGRPVHTWATALLASLGLGLAFLGSRRLRRQGAP